MTGHETVMNRLLQFRDAREWKKFHTPENLAKSISIEAGELLELFQWGDPLNMSDLRDELADILMYCYLLADSIGADPIEVMLHKIQKNEDRFPVDRVKGTSGKSTKE